MDHEHAGGFEQVSQHPKALWKLGSVVQPVKQDSVEQKRARRAAPGSIRRAQGRIAQIGVKIRVSR